MIAVCGKGNHHIYCPKTCLFFFESDSRYRLVKRSDPGNLSVYRKETPEQQPLRLVHCGIIRQLAWKPTMILPGRDCEEPDDIHPRALPDSAACRNQIRSEIRANHLSLWEAIPGNHRETLPLLSAGLSDCSELHSATTITSALQLLTTRSPSLSKHDIQGAGTVFLRSLPKERIPWRTLLDSISGLEP